MKKRINYPKQPPAHSRILLEATGSLKVNPHEKRLVACSRCKFVAALCNVDLTNALVSCFRQRARSKKFCSLVRAIILTLLLIGSTSSEARSRHSWQNRHLRSSLFTNKAERTISKPSSKPSRFFLPCNLPSLLRHITYQSEGFSTI